PGCVALPCDVVAILRAGGERSGKVGRRIPAVVGSAGPPAGEFASRWGPASAGLAVEDRLKPGLQPTAMPFRQQRALKELAEPVPAELVEPDEGAVLEEHLGHLAAVVEEHVRGQNPVGQHAGAEPVDLDELAGLQDLDEDLPAVVEGQADEA